mgnify:CR=1 FL=1
MQLEARGEATFDNLVQAADTLMYYAQKHKELTGLSSSLQSEIPQLYFDVDRDKVKMLGVPLADVFSTMKAYTGSVYVNDFNMFNRIYKVYIQAEAPYREHKDNINLFFVKAKDGVMVPLTSLGNASYTTGPGSIKRFNMFTTAVIRGSAAQGYSSGQAMEIMERFGVPKNIVGFVMPTGYTFNLDGSTLYLAMAVIFSSQIVGINLDLNQQIVIMLALMLTSKGIAGVPRVSLIVLAGTLASFNIPILGVAILLGIDQILDMGRTTVNLVGNCVATVVIARWEKEFDYNKMAEFVRLSKEESLGNDIQQRLGKIKEG